MTDTINKSQGLIDRGDHLATVFDKETGKHHGAYFENHSTPSGCPRPYLRATTAAGYDTANEAADAIETAFPDFPKLPRN